MPLWRDRVNDLLYDGETVRETVDVGTSRVAVTSHRVLAFTPDADGENYRQADLPNVEGVETSTDANDRWLRYAVRVGIVGGVMAVVGFLVDFGDIFGDISFDAESAGQVGAGGLIRTAETLIDIMAQLDFLLLAFGLLSLFLTAVLVGVYLFERDPTLVIRVAGEGGDIHLPRSEATDETRRRLEAALFPDPAGSSPTSAGHATGVEDGVSARDDSDDTVESGWN